ncbi:chemotaxis protein CheW [Rhodanobacter hydrolyticus]|uniref:Chemotaxis protein CheW n=1 Tax=Rhodanobacter hydrolyticus TaxID=2250595 RepID=A0ABW8J1I5_9GAMM
MTAPVSLLVFKLDLLRLGVSLAAVERVEHACEVTPLPGAPTAVLGVVNLHGHVAVVIDLRLRLGLPPRPISPADAFVVLALPQQLFVLPVSEAEGVTAVDSGDFVPGEALIQGVAQVRGLVKTPDGLLLIDDPQQFLDVHDMKALASALDARRAGQ